MPHDTHRRLRHGGSKRACETTYLFQSKCQDSLTPKFCPQVGHRIMSARFSCSIRARPYAGEIRLRGAAAEYHHIRMGSRDVALKAAASKRSACSHGRKQSFLLPLVGAVVVELLVADARLYQVANVVLHTAEPAAILAHANTLFTASPKQLRVACTAAL